MLLCLEKMHLVVSSLRATGDEGREMAHLKPKEVERHKLMFLSVANTEPGLRQAYEKIEKNLEGLQR